MRVLVTRAQVEAASLVAALQGKGFDAQELPLIAVAGPPQPQALAHSWERLADYDALMFVSGNAVQHFFAERPADTAYFGAHSPTPLRAYVTGPGSRAALRRAGVSASSIDGPDADAPQFDSEALWTLVADQVRPGFRLLVVRGTDGEGAQGQGRDWFGEQVRAAGGNVDYVVAYQRGLPVWTPAQQALARQSVHEGAVWLFSSSQAIRNLQALCPGQDWQAGRAVTTHARIAAAARAAGFGSVRESSPSIVSLVASIESLA